MIPSGKARMYYVLSTMDGVDCEITSLWIIIIRVWSLANCLASLAMFTWWQNWGRCCLDCRITVKSEVEYKHILHATRPGPGCVAQPGLCLLLVALVLLWRWGKLGEQTRWPWWRQEVLICIQHQFSLLKGTKSNLKMREPWDTEAGWFLGVQDQPRLLSKNLPSKQTCLAVQDLFPLQSSW